MNFSKIRLWFGQLNWLIVLITLLVFAGLIKLGLWQTSRAIEKEQRLARISSYQHSDALPLEQVLTLLKNNEDINDLSVSISGQFDDNYVFLLDNQTNNGRLGYRVLQLMHSDEHALLVNLGWVQGDVDRSKLPKIAAITGRHQITANIRVVEKGIVLAEQNYQQVTWPLRVQQIELDKFSQIIAQKLLPFVVYLDKKEQLGFIKNWQPIVMPPEKHRGYAFQWFSLALAWLVLMLSASMVRLTHNNNNKGEDV